MENLRIVEVYREGAWVVCRLHDVRKGDCFRMFEPDDLSSVMYNNAVEFIARSDGNQSGVLVGDDK